MSAEGKYNFSFTGASLRVLEFSKVMEAVCDEAGQITDEKSSAEDILRTGKASTSRREMTEFLRRVVALTPEQRELYLQVNLEGKKQLAFLGLCKSNAFVKDFVVEVVREKMLVFDHELTDTDFLSFYNRKMEQHSELENFAESTIKKARQNLFRMLQEAGIINDTRNKSIQQQWLDPAVVKSMMDDDPEYLKLFLQSEKDIELAAQW